MQRIKPNLAVHGFDWDWSKSRDRGINDHEYDLDNYGVIKSPEFDRTGYKFTAKNQVWYIVDCRVLLDDQGNDLNMYKDLIRKGIEFLKQGKEVVCCCSAGQSRSNSIALGILIEYFCMDFYDAWELLREKNPFCSIAMDHIDAIKYIYGVKLP